MGHGGSGNDAHESKCLNRSSLVLLCLSAPPSYETVYTENGSCKPTCER
jgi:hypothetical protein